MAQNNLDGEETRASIYITDHFYVYTDDPAHILIEIGTEHKEARFTKDPDMAGILTPEEVKQISQYRKLMKQYEDGKADPLDTQQAILDLFPNLSALGGGIPLISDASTRKRQAVGNEGAASTGTKNTPAKREPVSSEIAQVQELVKGHWTNEQIATVKDMTARAVTVSEFKIFMYQAFKYELDPLLREIFIVKYREDSPASIIVAHAGMLKKVALSGQYDGMKTETYWQKGMGDIPDHSLPHFDDNGEIDDIPLYVDAWAFRKGISNPGYFRAYYPTFVRKRKDGKPNEFWNTQPENMLRKCAEAGALRKQFPEVLGSLYISEEMPEQKTPSYVENEA